MRQSNKSRQNKRLVEPHVLSAFADHWNTLLHAPPQKRPGPPLKGTMKGRKSCGRIKTTGHEASAELRGPLLPWSASAGSSPGGGLTCQTKPQIGLTISFCTDCEEQALWSEWR